MSISTQELNNAYKNYNCKSLGIEDYEVEDYILSDDTLKIDNHVFYPRLIKFKKNGKKMCIVIAPKLKTVISKIFPFTFTGLDYDEEAMELEAKRLIIEA